MPSTTTESVYNVLVLSAELIFENEPHEFTYPAR